MSNIKEMQKLYEAMKKTCELKKLQSTPDLFCYDDTVKTTSVPPTIDLIVEKHKKKKEEKEQNMYANQITIPARTIEQDRRDYLIRRLHEVTSDHCDTLHRQFGLTDDPMPRTAKELVDRILSGKYLITEGNCSFSLWDDLHWRDPSIKRDQDGFNKAHDELLKAEDEVSDVIEVKGADEGLAALRAFEARTFN